MDRTTVASGTSVIMTEATTVRIAIVGTGYVGATTAYTLLLRGLAPELVLVGCGTAEG